MAGKSKKSSAIVPSTVESVEITRKEDVSIEAILTSAIDKGVSVETMERLMAMRRELKAEAAKEAFDTAMARFQSECPTINKTKEVRGKNGMVAYRYAPIESIVEQVKEPIQRNGFSYKTDQELKESGVKVIVRVIHSMGHSEETSMEVPFGSQTQIMSQSQVAAAATTFAKRYAFCNAFGILTGDEDTDAAPPRDESVIYRKDEPFGNTPVKPAPTPAPQRSPTELRKVMIGKHMLALGMDIRKMSKEKAEEAIEKMTGIKPSEDKLAEIVNRLASLANDEKERKEKLPPLTDADFGDDINDIF